MEMTEVDRHGVHSDSSLKDSSQVEQLHRRGMENGAGFQRHIRKAARPSDRFSSSALLSDSPESKRETGFKRKSMNLNLEKSLMLLDEAVGTPAPLLRSAGKKTSSASRRAAGFGSRLETSASMLGLSLTPGRSLLATPGSSVVGSLGESVMEGATTPSARFLSASRKLETTDITTTNVELLLEEDPAIVGSSSFGACSGLFGEFLQSYKNNPAEHQVFSLVEEFESLCSEQVALLKKLTKRTIAGQSKHVKVVDMLQTLSSERYTWRLITSLYRDRLETEAKGDTEEPMLLDMLGRNDSEKQVTGALYEREAALRQAQLVIDWLEKNAEEQLDDYYEKVEFFTDQSGSWENTLHYLQQKHTGVPLPSDRPIVNHIDPDAPLRERRPLADLDQDDEARLLRYLFAFVRAGQIEEAQQLCKRCGQSWRAATLEGWRLYHDPNYDSGVGADLMPVEGNPNRDIWKAACWRMAEEENLNFHEKAIYAALSGNLKHILPACQTWADYVWGYFRAYVDTRVEQQIRVSNTGDKTFEELDKTFWDKAMSADSIFKEIQASTNDVVRSEAKLRFHIIQKYIILGDHDALVEEMYEWLKDDSAPPTSHLLRFMTHLILFFRTIGVSIKREELCVAVLEAYVRQLIEDKQMALVATYTAALPQHLQLEWYARFLEGVQEADERKMCLDWAQEAGLDVSSITKLVVENIRNRDRINLQTDSEMPLDTGTTEEDRVKIEAIDWLVFDQSQRGEAMRQANAVMRTFLATRKHSAAREVFNKIPPGSIDIIMKSWKTQTGSTELPAEDDNTIREYLCIQAYLEAHDAFNDWFEHYHNAKPAKPEAPHKPSFTERVAFEHQQKQFEAELARWQHSLDLQSKVTVDKIYNVLLFVNGGWMVDQRDDGVTDDARSHQMTLLRQLCLPLMCFLLHTVLHTTQQFQLCLQLADTIASEQHQLYLVFKKDELTKLLQKLRESSLSLLDQNNDPLGYSAP